MSQVIINQAGPLPIQTTISWPSSETVLVAVSGSAFAKAPNTMLAVNLYIHNNIVGTVQLYANAPSIHMALPTGLFAVDGGYGFTTISLSAANVATATDPNDHWTVALVY